jgi:hypothetical protein
VVAQYPAAPTNRFVGAAGQLPLQTEHCSHSCLGAVGQTTPKKPQKPPLQILTGVVEGDREMGAHRLWVSGDGHKREPSICQLGV